jgi:hypothetical protein
MYINDDELRLKVKNILQYKTKNSIVTSIRNKGHKFQQYNLDCFLNKKSVSVDTLKKIDEFVLEFTS